MRLTSRLVLIDVGAAGGIPARWRGFGDEVDIIAFEPDPRAFSALEPGPGRRYLNVALHDHRGKVQLFLTRKQQCSSIFKPNRSVLDRFPDAGRLDVVGTQQVEVDTLDNQLAIAGVADADFLKVDVQGAELAVLRGATATLGDTLVGVEAEVSFLSLYMGQPLFSDVDVHLRGLGFELFDLNCEYWKQAAAPTFGSGRGQLAFADAVYLKTCEATLAMIGRQPDGSHQAKLLKAVDVAGMYGHDDHGFRLLEAGRTLLDVATFEAKYRQVRSRVPLQRRIPDFPGRRVAAGLAYQAYRFFRPRFWADYPTRYNRG